jgi:hypothetical protein
MLRVAASGTRLTLGLLTLAPSRAFASDASDASDASSAAAPPLAAPPAVPPPSYSDHWSQSLTRPFVAGIADVGAIARAKAMFGYGKPHWTWTGLELEGVTTTEFGATAVRARLALVLLDVAVAWRHTWAYDRAFVPRRARYVSADLTRGPAATYDSLDLWAWGLAPLPGGYADWEFEATRVYGAPAGRDLYEEYFRAVIPPGWATTARLGYAVTFAEDRGSAGAIGEWVWLGGRGSVFRVGPLATWAFSPYFDVALELTTVVSSPDALDFYDGLWGTARLRYRFAT